MTLAEAEPQMPVTYIPTGEQGRVSSKNDHFVFVKFNATVARLGWDGTTAQACRPEDLQR
jgi:hypothetical protein